MNFNDTTNKTGIIQMCERLTALGDAEISGDTTALKEFTARINHWYQKVITMILAAQDDWDFDDNTITTTNPIATRALVASRRDYAFTTNLWALQGKDGGADASAAALTTPLKVKRVDISYDGTNYYRANPIDSNELTFGLGNDTEVDGRFSKSAPQYDLLGSTLRIYPRADSTDVSNGGKIRVEFTREPTEFATSDTSKEAGFDEVFHPMLAIGPSYEFCVENDLQQKVNNLLPMLQDYEARLKQHYGRKDDDRAIHLAPLYVDYH